MKAVLVLVVACSTMFAADLPCFKITRMVGAVQNDSGRYLVESFSQCKGYVPDLYLKLRFELAGGRHFDTWESLHFVGPGKHFYEFSYPPQAQGFLHILLRGLEVKLEEVLK